MARPTMGRANRPRRPPSAMAAPWRASAKSTCSTPIPPKRRPDVTGPMLTEKQSRDLCRKLLSYVTADDAVVSVSSDDFSHLRFAANGFTTCGRREDASAHVTVWIKKQRGSASANDLDEASLRDAVQQAEQIASTAPVDKEYLPTLGPQIYKPSSDYVEATVNLSLSHRAQAIDEIIGGC